MRYAIAILAVIALILFGVLIFGGGGSKTPTKPVVTPKTLPEYYDTSAQVRYTISGRVVGNELHHQIRITVGQTERKVEILEGYPGTVIKTQYYDNNSSAYDVFLRAIAGAGFTLKLKKPLVTDDRGLCPLGQIYIYELINTDDDADQRLWSSSCGAKVGTFAGAPSLVRTLFQNQLPPAEYNKFIAGVRL